MSERHRDGEFKTIDDWIAHLQAEHWPLEEWAAEDLRAELELGRRPPGAYVVSEHAPTVAELVDAIADPIIVVSAGGKRATPELWIRLRSNWNDPMPWSIWIARLHLAIERERKDAA